jgi:short-subunit dehydrogenase
MIDYAGQTALVTGAASGIGRALAQALAARGAHLVLADLDTDGMAELAAELGDRTRTFQLDLSEIGAGHRLVDWAFAAVGPIDLICSNAGVGRNRRLVNESLNDTTQRLLRVNTFAALEIAQSYLKQLDAAGRRGRLIVTGSENSLSVPAMVRKAGLGVYAASKHALLILCEWLREELGEESALDLHLLLPAGVYTPLLGDRIGSFEEAAARFAVIRPERCAEIALRGMDLGLFYIPTHPHIADDMRPRVDGVTAALRALGLTEEP